MRNSLRFSIILVSGLLTSVCWAQEGVQTSIHHHYQSTRALGMGDAFVATADDYTALFYNPAGLARLKHGQLSMSMEFGGGLDVQKFYKEIGEIDKITYANDGEKQLAYAQLLNTYYGKTLGFRVKAFEAIWARPGWAIGIVPLDFTFDAQVHNQGTPALDVRAFADTTIAYGYADDLHGVVPGRLSWGTTVKMINRGYINREVNSLSLVADSSTLRKEDARDGYTVDFDLGTLYTPRIPTEGFFSLFQLAKPTFGAVVRNIADYGFGNSFKLINKEKVDAPEKLNRVLDLGAKFEYPELWIFGGRGEIDIRDIGHPNFTWRRSFHLGFEFDWTVTTWWKGQYRIGVNQGYPSLGLSALLFIFNLDLATYGEEVGTFHNPKENRIYMAKMSLDF
ncbi:MAG: hypothetical protein ACXWC9_01385 [Pseudobdellovibrionaceae bacterium]